MEEERKEEGQFLSDEPTTLFFSLSSMDAGTNSPVCEYHPRTPNWEIEKKEKWMMLSVEGKSFIGPTLSFFLSRLFRRPQNTFQTDQMMAVRG